MKYIAHNAHGFLSYDSYFRYLESVRTLLRNDLYSFASNLERHDLTSKGSLHDSWIESLYVKAFYERELGNFHDHDVEIVLLGPYHDRKHILRYFKVEKCVIDFQFCNEGRKRDLLCHELRYENNFIEHEFLFDGDMTIEIVCGDMKHEEIFFNL